MEASLSRRNFFKFMLAVGAVSFGTVSLHAKAAKLVVKYQQKSTTGKRCKECAHFLPDTNECKLVEGKINPAGWCTFYLNKNTKKA